MRNRPATMPPPMASRLTPGFNGTQRYMRSKVRGRLIAKGLYGPYAVMFAFLRAYGVTSMREVASRASLPYARVSKILRGHTEPQFYAGMAIARAIGCTPEALDTYLAVAQRAPMRPERLDAQVERARQATAWREGMTQPIPTGGGNGAPPPPPRSYRPSSR